jgi:hypothetical protein
MGGFLSKRTFCSQLEKPKKSPIGVVLGFGAKYYEIVILLDNIDGLTYNSKEYRYDNIEILINSRKNIPIFGIVKTLKVKVVELR